MFSVRKALTKDFPGIVECIKTVRGEDCYPADIYDPVLLSKRTDIRFLAALTPEEKVVGVIAMMQNSFEQSLSLVGMLAVYNEYTGNGIASKLLEQSARILFDEGARAVNSHVVTSHTKVQNKYEKMAFTPTGFYFGVTERDKDLSGGVIQSRKCSLVNYVRPGEKYFVGTLYLPDFLQPLAERIYDTLDVAFHFEEATAPAGEIGRTQFEQNNAHKICYLQISQWGRDLAEKIPALLASIPDDRTFIAYLSMNHPSIIEGFDQLLSMGFRFSGFEPLSEAGEWLLMSRYPPGSVFPEELITTSQASSLLSEVLSLGKKSE